jgi:site-specific DNA recombinase
MLYAGLEMGQATGDLALGEVAVAVKLRLQRLRKGIEMGALDIEDPSLQERLVSLRALKARTAEETASLQAELDRVGTVTISASMLSAVIETAGQGLLERGDGFRRGYASAFAARMVAEADKVRITCTQSRRFRTSGQEQWF